MHLYHQRCRGQVARPLRWLPRRLLLAIGQLSDRRGVSRLRLVPQGPEDVQLCVRTYRCEGCTLQVHADMDWPECATPEPRARID